MKKLLIGVDEAGRGPLAGPVSVGVVAVEKDFDIKAAFPGVGDSKALSEKKREELFAIAEALQQRGDISYVVVFASAEEIDRDGIVPAIRASVYKGVEQLAPEALGVHVLLDGLLNAPPAYSQQTIIKGDATEPVISLASILAKVSRDRVMVSLAKMHPEYGFEKHKGYGTKAHIEAIQKFGLSPMHRRSYCRSL